MPLKIGNKVRVRKQSITHNLELEIWGKINSITGRGDAAECIVEFKLTREQIYSLGWSQASREGELYVTRRYYFLNDLVLTRVLTEAEEAELVVLKAKANRSPVEEYLIHSMEEC
jgi:hypothetical protein